MPMFGKAEMPPIEETCSRWPLPCSRRIGSAACVTHNAPKTFVSNWSRASASLISSIMPKLAVARVVDDDV